jgi:hypothetical protein
MVSRRAASSSRRAQRSRTEGEPATALRVRDPRGSQPGCRRQLAPRSGTQPAAPLAAAQSSTSPGCRRQLDPRSGTQPAAPVASQSSMSQSRSGCRHQLAPRGSQLAAPVASQSSTSQSQSVHDPRGSPPGCRRQLVEPAAHVAAQSTLGIERNGSSGGTVVPVAELDKGPGSWTEAAASRSPRLPASHRLG